MKFGKIEICKFIPFSLSYFLYIFGLYTYTPYTVHDDDDYDYDDDDRKFI